MAYKYYETERLILKPTTEDDAEFIIELLNSPTWLKYIGNRNVTTKTEAEEYINKRIKPQLDRIGISSFTLVTKADNIKVGLCGLYDREGLDGFDIGFALLPEFENNGYALESAIKVKEIAINELKLNEIKAITTKDNVASQRLLEKLGLQFNSTIRIPNDDEELLLYKYLIE